MSESKKITTPLERGTKKLDLLMRAFGMRTRVFKGKTRAIVKGTRKIYPEEVNATIVETARGIGIRVKSEKLWYSFLKLLPFTLLWGIAILEFTLPSIGENMSKSIGINIFHMFLGPTPNSLGLIIALPIIALVVVTAELAERFIRIRYIQDRMPRFLSGAEWKVSEPPLILDAVATTSNIFWLSYVFLIIIYAPLSFSTNILNKFLEVYKTSFSALLDKTTFVSLLDIGIISSMFFAYLFLKYENFRGELDREQVRHDIQLETSIRQLFQIMAGAAFMAIIESLVFSFSFWSNASMVSFAIFFGITLLTATIATWILWQRENYIYITLAIWFFISDVVLIFLNANNSSYSWMIICHLFLIILVPLIYLNTKFGSYLEQKEITEPSWMFNPLPIFAYIAFWKKKKKRRGKKVEKELEEMKEEEMRERIKEREPLVINIEKIKKKGKHAEKVIQTYQKITKHMFKGELNISIFTEINKQILEITKDNNKLSKNARQFIEAINHLLWDETFRFTDDEGANILKIGEQIYEEVLKRR